MFSWTVSGPPWGCPFFFFFLGSPSHVHTLCFGLGPGVFVSVRGTLFLAMLRHHLRVLLPVWSCWVPVSSLHSLLTVVEVFCPLGRALCSYLFLFDCVGRLALVRCFASCCACQRFLPRGQESVLLGRLRFGGMFAYTFLQFSPLLLFPAGVRLGRWGFPPFCTYSVRSASTLLGFPFLRDCLLVSCLVPCLFGTGNVLPCSRLVPLMSFHGSCLWFCVLCCALETFFAPVSVGCQAVAGRRVCFTLLFCPWFFCPSTYLSW